MGLKGDFSELAIVWRNSPWRIRIVLVLSGFLAASSLASLSEAVAKWKGFLLVGLTFYRDHVRDLLVVPLRDWLDVPISSSGSDFLVLVLLIYGALGRAFLFNLRVNSDWVNEPTTVPALIALSIGLAYLVLVATVPVPAFNFWCAFAAVAAIFLLTYVPPRSADKLLIRVYLLLPPLLVCMVAAINLGLT
jgi:hypothetical protein